MEDRIMTLKILNRRIKVFDMSNGVLEGKYEKEKDENILHQIEKNNRVIRELNSIIYEIIELPIKNPLE